MCPYVCRGLMTVFIHVVCSASENTPLQSKDYNVSNGRHASVGALTCDVACLPLMGDSYSNYLGLEWIVELFLLLGWDPPLYLGVRTPP